MEVALGVLDRRLAPREASFSPFLDDGGKVIDEGIALWFPGPHSYTGEDVLELQGHGGRFVLDLVLDRVLALGARPARPGEFTERAFLNGKLDLSQAEAVADLIDAGSRAAARAAVRSLQGEFSNAVDAVSETLVGLRVLIEAALDFSDEEDVPLVSVPEIERSLESLGEPLRSLIAAATEGAALRDGISVAIIGPPNVGKSSLLNRLTATQAAIVTEVAGTTRDVVERDLDIEGIPLKLADTAGLRETEDPIEAIGVERALAVADEADIVLSVESSDPAEATTPGGSPGAGGADARLISVVNKIDLSGLAPGWAAGSSARGVPQVRVSALTGAGIIELKREILRTAGVTAPGFGGAFTARRRHLDALRRAEKAVSEALATVGAHGTGALELVTEDVRRAHRALGEITGEFSIDDLLGEIFSAFCIGK